MPYKVEFLPSASEDIAAAADYIAHALQNPAAAERFAEQTVAAAEALADFPYRNPAYTPIRPLAHEYRRFTCGNYLGFYWVDEGTQTVTVARVIYAKRDIDAILNR